MRTRKSSILAPALASLAIAGMVACDSRVKSSQANAVDIPSASVAVAQRGSISRTLSLAGQFQAYQVVDIHPKVSGFIRSINVDIGDRVHKGQTLAVLEVPELSAQLKGTVAEVERSKDEIARAENEVLRAQSEHTALHQDYTRLKQASAAQPGLIAEQELDDAQSKDMAAEAQIDAAKAALSAARQQTAVAGADNERVSALADYTKVIAPLDGVIIWRYADTGALIQSGTTSDVQSLPIVKLAQTGLLRLRMPVPEDAVKYVHAGNEMRIRVDAIGRSFTGKVVRFTHNVSLETRTMETEVDVENKNLSIDPGMYANTELQLAHVENVLTIPVVAIVEQDPRQVVYVLDRQNRVRVRPVQVGIEGSLLAEIKGGLNEGDRVIVGGLDKYQQGEQVAPIVEKTSTSDVTRQTGGMIDLNNGQDGGDGGVR